MGVAITGIGAISAIGNTVDANLACLLDGQTGIAQAQLVKHPKSILTGEVKLTNKALKEYLDLPDSPISRTALLGMMAAKEAWGDNKTRPDLRTGIISSTSVGGMDITEQYYMDLVDGKAIDAKLIYTHDSGNTTERIADLLGISGYINTLSTACSSAANSIMLGARLIEQGKLDRVLVGGTDALTSFTINGFGSLMIYDSEWCRPFDDTRAGLNLGEAAGFLLLESEKSLTVTGNKVICELTGWCNAADAYHQTASSPDGKGATFAIKGALAKAQLRPEQISYVNAHGTGTKNNDLSESTALINVFGKEVPPFSSTKAFTGHTLAAAGAIEAVYSVLAITEGMYLPNLNYNTPLEETGLVPVTEVTRAEVKHVLSNSFGFGGNNSSLVFSKASL